MSIPQKLLNVRIEWADFDSGEFSNVPCNICGSFDFNTIGSLLINSIEFFLVECSKCSLIWRNPLPGETFLSSLYNKNYFDVPAKFPILKDQVGVPDNTLKEKRFRDEISTKVVESWINLGVLPYNQKGKPQKLLEIGGGRGYLQKAAQKRGWATLGIEISHYGIEEARHAGLQVLDVPLYKIQDCINQYNEYFDVIVFYDFLEHLTDPAQALWLIRNMLKNSGIIIFRVPKTEGCPTLHLVDHIWHFSIKSLKYLLQKECFDVWHAHYSGRYHAENGAYIDNITIFANKIELPANEIPAEIDLHPNPLGL